MEHKMEDIIILGNCFPSEHESGRVVSKEGIAPTVMENHGSITKVIVKEYQQNDIPS